MLSKGYLRLLRFLLNATHEIGVCSIQINKSNLQLVNDNRPKYLKRVYLNTFLSVYWLLEYAIRIKISLKQKNINTLNVGTAFLFLTSIGVLILCFEVFFSKQLCQLYNGFYGLLLHVQGKYFLSHK